MECHETEQPAHSVPDGAVPEQTEMATEHIVDFNVFKQIESGDQCNGKHHGTCKGLDRMIVTLDYHQFVVNEPSSTKDRNDRLTAFVAFCDELYSKRAMLNDYIHFVEHHADPQSIEYIKGRLHFDCESAEKCGATTRHYRDRREDSTGAKGMESSWFIDRMDSIHFMVYHLTELGLRVSAKTMESAVAPDDDEKDEAVLVDLALKEMGKEIEAKRREFSTERLDGAANSKFTLNVEEKKESGGILVQSDLVMFWSGKWSKCTLSI